MIIPGHADCARQLWESAGSAKLTSNIGCGLGASGGLPDGGYFANMVRMRNAKGNASLSLRGVEL